MSDPIITNITPEVPTPLPVYRSQINSPSDIATALSGILSALGLTASVGNAQVPSLTLSVSYDGSGNPSGLLATVQTA